MADKYENLVHDLQKELDEERHQFKERMEEKQERILQLQEMLQQQRTATAMISQDHNADTQSLQPDETGRPRLNMAPWQAPFYENEMPNMGMEGVPFTRTKTKEDLEKNIGTYLEPYGLDPQVTIGKQALYDARDGLADPSQFVSSWKEEEMAASKSDIKKKGHKGSKRKTKASTKHTARRDKP